MAIDSSKPVRVMVVEDDSATRQRFVDALSADPRIMPLAAAGTGREALAALRSASPEVLLVDLGLPDMHGTTVIRCARETCPDCDIMVITMFGDESNVVAIRLRRGRRPARHFRAYRDQPHQEQLPQAVGALRGRGRDSGRSARCAAQRRLSGAPGEYQHPEAAAAAGAHVV